MHVGSGTEGVALPTSVFPSTIESVYAPVQITPLIAQNIVSLIKVVSVIVDGCNEMHMANVWVFIFLLHFFFFTFLTVICFF